ncbi:class I SAM-dependent methyltransferase [Roseateles sp.]|uniref:class I SAM-dependent methyltransferase n=1 Tax=Roseateles sp. TaxID=1971397 RepID=UPI0039EA3AD0
MDARTSAFYDAYATQLAATEAGRSAMFSSLQAALVPGAWVLDVGSGSGRDMAALLEHGFEALGVEPNAAMRETALRLRPGLADRLADASLPDLGRPFYERRPQGFDAVVCSAVLMHVEPAGLTPALASLAGQLRQPVDGETAHRRPALLISLPEMLAERLKGDRDVDGRRFHNHEPTRVQALLAGWGLELDSANRSDAALAGTGTRWHTLLFRQSVKRR